MSDPWTTFAVLGTGKTEAGVKQLNLDSFDLVDLAVLDHGASVYALARDALGRSIAAGTRSGLLSVFRSGVDGKGLANQMPLQRIQFSQPILAACFVGPDRIAVATKADTFWVESGDMNKGCHHLDTHGDFVCSLVAVSDSEALSVSSQGQVLGWRLPEGETFKRLCGPSPGTHAALVRLAFCPEANSVFYGAASGDLVEIPLDKTGITVHPAHHGELYSVCACGQRLLTVGKADGVLKLWRGSLDAPEYEAECRKGITAATFLDDDPIRILVVDESGGAEVLRLQQKALVSIKRLPGQSYRAVLGPNIADVRVARAKATASRAKAVWMDACARIRSKQWDDLIPLLHEMEALGQADAALLLRAKQAMAQEDLVAEFRFRHELYHRHGKSRPAAAEWAQEYATLLERCGCFGEASEVYQGLSSGACDDMNREKRRLAYQRAQWLADIQTIMIPVVDLAAIVGVWDIVQKPFSGRWVIRQGDSSPACRGVTVTTTEILREFVGDPLNDTDSVHVTRETPAMVGQDQVTRVDALVFERDGGKAAAHLQLVVRMDPDESAITFRPMAVLCVAATTPECDWKQHNHCVKAVINSGNNKHLRPLWMERTLGEVNRAIRMVVTKKLVARNSRI